MTHPHITLTIEQAREMRRVLDDVAKMISDEFCLHTPETLCGAENKSCLARDVYQAAKILSTELECLRYL